MPVSSIYIDILIIFQNVTCFISVYYVLIVFILYFASLEIVGYLRFISLILILEVYFVSLFIHFIIRLLSIGVNQSQ